MEKVKLLFTLFITSYLFSSSAQADELKPIQLSIAVFEEVKVIHPQGKMEYQLIEPSNVVPGDTVVYITQYHNQNSQPANNVVITNPIPKHLMYVKDSAIKTKTHVTYSIDAGKSFHPANKLIVQNKNGSQRPATEADYTHIQWIILSIPPKEKNSVRFSAQIK